MSTGSTPQPLYDETMSWTAQQRGTRFGVPVYLLHGDADQHTLTSLVEEYYPMIEAPAKNLLLPSCSLPRSWPACAPASAGRSTHRRVLADQVRLGHPAVPSRYPER